MVFEDFAALVELDNELDLGLNQDDISCAEFTLFLGDEESQEYIGPDDIIGISDAPFLGVGDCFQNPFDTKNSTYLEVISVDNINGRAILTIRAVE